MRRIFSGNGVGGLQRFALAFWKISASDISYAEWLHMSSGEEVSPVRSREQRRAHRGRNPDDENSYKTSDDEAGLQAL